MQVSLSNKVLKSSSTWRFHDNAHLETLTRHVKQFKHASYLLEGSQWCAHCLDELPSSLAYAAVAKLVTCYTSHSRLLKHTSYLLEGSQWCAHCLDELPSALAHAAGAGLGARLHATAAARLAA
jgi:hypothetical protein